MTSGKDHRQNVLLRFVEKIKGMMSGRNHDQTVLQEILDELKRPAGPNEMPRRIELCLQALALITKETQPEPWGFLQNALALSLAQTPIGSKADNFERAIHHFQLALEVRDRQRYPKEWASTQNNLGTAYRDRIFGDPALNIEEAIRRYEQALEVRTQTAYPEHWALTLNNLAHAYYKRLQGPRSENLETAIQYFEQALEIRDRQRYPTEWASTMNDLATAYRDRIAGKPSQNIEKAILYYQQALELRTRETDPERWALTQNNLGVAYTVRICGERAENLEWAIQHAQQALDVYTLMSPSEGWAQAHNTLGEAYRARILGSRMDNIERAIQHFQQALEVNTPPIFAADRAMVQNNLAAAYSDRIAGERADNIELAIQHAEQALKVYTDQSYPHHWALLQYNLGNAYRNRIRGDQAENIEQAIRYFYQALKVHKRHTFPKDWSQVHNNLGIAYLARILGKPVTNVERAIRHFKQALEVRTFPDFPADWAQTRNNLGNAYLTRTRGERIKNLEQAILNYRQALKVRTRQAFPEDWAETLNNLAGAERARSAEDIEQAIDQLQQALEVYALEAFPQNWARTQNNLAIAYADRKQGERTENINLAIQHYQQALTVYTREAYPDHCLKSARALGNLAFDERRWELAGEAYDTAFRAQDVLMQASFSPAGKQAELSEVQHLPARAAYAHVQLGNVKQAVEVLEKGRAQLLRESLERQRQDLKELPKLKFKRLYDDYEHALQQYNDLQSKGISQNAHPEDWISSMDQALKKVHRAAAAIREEVGPRHPEYRYFLQALPFDEIQKQARQGALVYLCATSAGGLALVVTKSDVQAIELPKLNQVSLQKQIWSPSDEEVERINDHIQQRNITPEDIQAVSGGYFSMYALWSLLATPPRGLGQRLFPAWQETLDQTTGWLWETVMGELIPVLQKHSQSTILIPVGQLAFLPLHAAWTKDESRPTRRQYALDEMNITYAPSAHALWQASLAAARPTDRLLAVENPEADNPRRSLAFAKDEVKAVSSGFDKTRIRHLQGKDATLEVVKEEMQKAEVLHFATHGNAGWEKAEQAQLRMADGGLTLPNIFALPLTQARLAVLSACETGVPGLELIDEMIGLPAGMMQAGVPGVVGSLWSVSDMSTAMLMARFYSLWRQRPNEEKRPAPQEALRQAQIWLRDSTTQQKKELFENFVEGQAAGMSAAAAEAFYEFIAWKDPNARTFSSPFYWAAFTYTGI